MRKRNKLYTVNRWNHPLYAGSRIFDAGGSLASWDQLASDAYGANYGEKDYTLDDYMDSTNILGISKKNNPFSKGNLAGFNIGNVVAKNAGTIGTAIGTIGNRAISGGFNSGVGNAVSGIGSAVGGIVGAANPVLGGAISAATGLIGGGINALFGTKTDQKKLNAANAGTDYLNSFQSNATTFDAVQSPDAVAAVQNPYKGGLFRKGWARKKNAELKAQRASAESWANRSVTNNVDNIADTQMDTIMANYSALGGPLDNQGAIDYNFMSDYLLTKDKAVSKDKIPSNVFGSLQSTPFFALGGDIQTNGADFTTGLSEIEAGGSHEENPYSGVQIGINRENGQPNLVEEGETIFDDYVYSKRIKADDKTKERFHISKNTDISYADLSKKLQKEGEERPNDPISQKGLSKQLHDLAEEQERQKAEESAKAAQEAFNTLSPEQQQEIMRQIAMQQEASLQGQETQGQQDQMPDFYSDMEQTEQQPEQQEIQTEPQTEGDTMEQMNACGGRINRYDKGGDLKKKIYKLLGLHTDRDFNEWTDSHRMPKIKDWDNILGNKYFLEAIGKSNPSLRDALSRGYDFGTYIPTKDTLTFDFTHGGWGNEDYSAWEGSEDAAWKEAVEKGLVKQGMNSDEIGKALMQTEAYKRGTDWLKNSEDNRLKYLQAIYNSAEAPQAARDFAGKYVNKDGWIKDAKRDYQTIFEDPNGEGVRNTHPGTYWKTPNEVLRNSKQGNFVVNDDGTVEEIIGEVPEDWTPAGDYSWADDGNDYRYRYYKRNGSNGSNEISESDEENIAPVHKATWGRTAGLMGPLVGLGMQAMGIGKPDYSRTEAALGILNGNPSQVSYKPIGNYIGYRPMDIWYEQNRMNANSRATDRAIRNNASPIGTKMAGLLANGYNEQTAMGNLYRQALEYNDAQRQKAAEFNRGTDMFNSEAYSRTSQANAEIQNRNRQLRAQMAMEAANQRMAADTAWNQGIYGNVNALFKGLGEWGKENAQHNMIADMAADGIFGNMSDRQNIGRGYVTRKACGGKLKKKKGLTI